MTMLILHISIILLAVFTHAHPDTLRKYGRDWLIPQPDPQVEPKRITAKSVFITPKLDSNVRCAQGYRKDAQERCVKIVHVNQAAQLDFLLERLNAMYAAPVVNHSETQPLQVDVEIPVDIVKKETESPHHHEENKNQFPDWSNAPVATSSENSEPIRVILTENENAPSSLEDDLLLVNSSTSFTQLDASGVNDTTTLLEDQLSLVNASVSVTQSAASSHVTDTESSLEDHLSLVNKSTSFIQLAENSQVNDTKSSLKDHLSLVNASTSVNQSAASSLANDTKPLDLEHMYVAEESFVPLISAHNASDNINPHNDAVIENEVHDVENALTATPPKRLVSIDSEANAIKVFDEEPSKLIEETQIGADSVQVVSLEVTTLEPEAIEVHNVHAPNCSNFVVNVDVSGVANSSKDLSDGMHSESVTFHNDVDVSALTDEISSGDDGEQTDNVSSLLSEAGTTATSTEDDTTIASENSNLNKTVETNEENGETATESAQIPNVWDVEGEVSGDYDYFNRDHTLEVDLEVDEYPNINASEHLYSSVDDGDEEVAKGTSNRTVDVKNTTNNTHGEGVNSVKGDVSKFDSVEQLRNETLVSPLGNGNVENVLNLTSANSTKAKEQFIDSSVYDSGASSDETVTSTSSNVDEDNKEIMESVETVHSADLNVQNVHDESQKLVREKQESPPKLQLANQLVHVVYPQPIVSVNVNQNVPPRPHLESIHKEVHTNPVESTNPKPLVIHNSNLPQQMPLPMNPIFEQPSKPPVNYGGYPFPPLPPLPVIHSPTTIQLPQRPLPDHNHNVNGFVRFPTDRDPVIVQHPQRHHQPQGEVNAVRFPQEDNQFHYNKHNQWVGSYNSWRYEGNRRNPDQRFWNGIPETRYAHDINRRNIWTENWNRGRRPEPNYFY